MTRLPRGRARGSLLALVLTATTPLPAEAQKAGSYQIDPASSRVEIFVFRAGFFSGLGDNHVILLTRFSGNAAGRPGDPWSVSVTGDARSLEVKDTNLSESDRHEMQATMLGPTQLDAERFPTIELRSRAVEPGRGSNALRLIVDLTLHGVTRQVDFPLAWKETSDGMRVEGKKQLRLTDFGIEPIRKFLGAIQVKNEFEVRYDLTLKRVP